MIRRGSRRAWLGLWIALGAVAPTCHACSCGRPALDSIFAGNDNVFTAVITGGTLSELEADYAANLSFGFEVTEVYKGKIPFDRLTGHLDGPSCGRSLDVGYEYLIFVEDDGRFGLCSAIEVVSPPSERTARGIEYLRTLRAAKAGDASALDEPWRFEEDDGACSLYTRFAGGSKGWDASLRITFRHSPTQRTLDDPPDEAFLVGFSEVDIWIPVSSEERPDALTVRAGDRTFTAYWRDSEHDSGGFAVQANDMVPFIRALPDTDHVTFTGLDTAGLRLEATVRTSRLGTGAADMLRCMGESD